jgi:hypothetical protein
MVHSNKRTFRHDKTNTKIKTGRDQQAAGEQNRILSCSAQTEWGHSAQPPSTVNISVVELSVFFTVPVPNFEKL